MTARLGRDEAAVLLELLVTRCPVVVYVLDADGVCTYSAGTPLARLGLAPGELVGAGPRGAQRPRPGRR